MEINKFNNSTTENGSLLNLLRKSHVLANTHTSTLDTSNVKLDTINTSITSGNGTLTNIESESQQANINLGTIDSSIGTTNTTLTTTNTTLTNIRTDLSDINALITSQNADIDLIREYANCEFTNTTRFHTAFNLNFVRANDLADIYYSPFDSAANYGAGAMSTHEITDSGLKINLRSTDMDYIRRGRCNIPFTFGSLQMFIFPHIAYSDGDAITEYSMGISTRNENSTNGSHEAYFKFTSGAETTLEVFFRTPSTFAAVPTASFSYDSFDGNGPSGLTISFADVDIDPAMVVYAKDTYDFGFMVNGKFRLGHRFQSNDYTWTEADTLLAHPAKYFLRCQSTQNAVDKFIIFHGVTCWTNYKIENLPYFSRSKYETLSISSGVTSCAFAISCTNPVVTMHLNQIHVYGEKDDFRIEILIDKENDLSLTGGTTSNIGSAAYVQNPTYNSGGTSVFSAVYAEQLHLNVEEMLPWWNMGQFSDETTDIRAILLITNLTANPKLYQYSVVWHEL